MPATWTSSRGARSSTSATRTATPGRCSNCRHGPSPSARGWISIGRCCLPGSTAGRVLAVADDDTSIKVSRQTRERLARLAAERGSTLKDVVEELAAATLTAAELSEREQRARAVLAEHFGVVVTEAELAASARLREKIARREAAA